MNASHVKPAAERSSFWGLWLGLSLLTVALSVWIRIMAPGWYLIVFGVVLCGFIIVHPVIHAVGARKAGRYRLQMPILLLVSNLLFLLGFGFQVDYGDSSDGYMAFQSFAHQVFLKKPGPPVADEASTLYLVLAVGSLIALVVSWLVILIMSARGSDRKIRTEQVRSEGA